MPTRCNGRCRYHKAFGEPALGVLRGIGSGVALMSTFPGEVLEEKVEKFASPAVAAFLLSTRPVYWEVCRENTNALGMGSCRTVCLTDTSSQYCNFTPSRVRKALCCLSPVGC